MANSGSKYQVFLNFCGKDTRRGFTNTLYHALVDTGIRVFLDKEEISLGEEFSKELLQAIDDSKLYITIFSPNYASQHWCLRELAKMVEITYGPEEDGNKKVDNTSKREGDVNKKVIFPIFYKVRPNDLKSNTGLYSEAISELEQKMEDQKRKFSMEEVKKWRWALQKVDGIQGLKLEDYEGDGDLSKLVVNEVVDRLKTRQREVTEDLVGIEDRIAAINNLLDIDSGGVRLIGICGMGGMGKTTLAKKIFNQLCPRFGKYCSFLDDVRETAKTNGLIKLREQLFSDISNSRGARNSGNTNDVIKAIEDTICNKKVLIVLDDVDDGNQIQNLIGRSSLYPGTRILVTTRDNGVLTIRGAKYEILSYEMEGLSDEDALQLFSRHAFDDNSPPSDYNSLSKSIVSTTGGLPLALQAIGSSLFDRGDIEIWKEMLEELRKTPHDDVLGKLRITYNTLKSGQQQIFLDVACFFIGSDGTNPIYMWKDCGFSPKSAIDVLINRCMIKVLDNNKFWMHDQFRALGRAIANQEHSRLWADDYALGRANQEHSWLWADDYADGYKFRKFRSTEINESIRLLQLDSRMHEGNLTAEQIKQSPRLRLLWLDDVTFQGNFTGCLSELRWIKLHNYSENREPQFTATNLHLENLIVMDIRDGEMAEDTVRRLIEGARKLKVLAISFCDFFKEIHCSIGKLTGLTDLSVEFCEALEKLPEHIGDLKNLQHLSLRECKNLRELPNSVSKLESLMKLDVSGTGITRLPESIGRLQRLSSLKASRTNIVKLPGTMSELHRLQTLNLEHCHKIRELPKLPGSLTTLLLISRSLQIVPNLSNLTNLVELLLSDDYEGNNESNVIQACDLLWIGRLSKLRELRLSLLNVRTMSTDWGSLSLLEELTLYGVDLQTLKQLPSSLRVLKLDNTRVKQVDLDGLPQLEWFTITRCELITRISITSSLRKLEHAKVDSCDKLVEVQFLGFLKSMKRLSITECKSLERLVCQSEEAGCSEVQAPELSDGGRRVSLLSSSLSMLKELSLRSCPELQEIQFVSALESMRTFSVENCVSLKYLVGLSNLKVLGHLNIVGCHSLQDVRGVKLEFLAILNICWCTTIEGIFGASVLRISDGCWLSTSYCGKYDPEEKVYSYTMGYYREHFMKSLVRESHCEIEDSETETGDDPVSEQDQENKEEKRERETEWAKAGEKIPKGLVHRGRSLKRFLSKAFVSKKSAK